MKQINKLKNLPITMQLSLLVTLLLLITIGITINNALTKQEVRSRANSNSVDSQPTLIPSSAIITTVDNKGDVGMYNAIAIGADGLPIISYLDLSDVANNRIHLKVLKCGNASCSSGNTITTIDSAGIALFPSITIDKKGLPAIVYTAISSDNLTYPKLIRCGNASCSSGNTITDVNTPDKEFFYHLLIGIDGLPIIGYINNDTYVKVIACGNAGCTSGNKISILDSNAAGIPFQFVSFVLGTDGFPLMSYNYNSQAGQTSMGSLKVAKCGNAICSSGNKISVVYSKTETINPTPTLTNKHSFVGSVIVKNNGLPTIIFDDMSANLYTGVIINCGNSDCSQSNRGNTISLPDQQGISYYNSFGLAADGLPIISYHAGYGTGLKILKCGNMDCNVDNIAAVIDNLNNPGTFNRLVIGNDGFPVISYYEETDKVLKVAKCGTISCTQTQTISTTPSTPNPTGTPSMTKTPGPIQASTTIKLNLLLHGIGSSGDNPNPNDSSLSNKNPLHPQRNIDITLIDSNNQIVKKSSSSVVYGQGIYAGVIDLGPAFPTGNYIIKIKSAGHLRKMMPGVVNIETLKDNTLPQTALVAGDVNGDNALNILDYNILRDCGYGEINPLPLADPNSEYNSRYCKKHDPYRANVDLDDNGIVNSTEYNLFLRELSVLSGD